MNKHRRNSNPNTGQLRPDFKKVFRNVMIFIIASILIAQSVNVYFANRTVSEMIRLAQEGNSYSVTKASTQRDRLMYEDYLLIQAGGDSLKDAEDRHRILSALYSRTKIEKSFVFPLLFRSEVTLEIDSVDMEAILPVLLEQMPKDASREEIIDMLCNSIAQAEVNRHTTLTVPMELVNGAWRLETESSGLREAMEGYLSAAYTHLYVDMLEMFFGTASDSDVQLPAE